jgi:SH3 domain protein
MKRHGRRCILLAAFLVAELLAANAARAEQLYVADKLVLNVYAQATPTGDKIATLETGDAVEGLERVENFVHVRLGDGREGWIGANYLTPEAPAILRLKALQAEQRADTQSVQKPLNDEIARLQKQNATLQTELNALKQRAAQPAPAAAAPTTTTEAPLAEADEPAQIDEVAQQPADHAVATNAWWLWPLLIVAGLAVGFPLGYQTLAWSIRRKYGGVKVY